MVPKSCLNGRQDNLSWNPETVAFRIQSWFTFLKTKVREKFSNQTFIKSYTVLNKFKFCLNAIFKSYDLNLQYLFLAWSENSN